MVRSVLVEDGVVTNVILGEIAGSIPLPEGVQVGIGWAYDGKVFTAPPIPDLPPEPLKPISQRQLRLALSNADLILKDGTPSLIDLVEPKLRAIPDERERRDALIEWEMASQIEPGNDLVVYLRSALGLSEPQMDTLWRYAETL